MIAVVVQSMPRLPSRLQRPAGAVFRIDQNARCVEMSESGTKPTWRDFRGESIVCGKADIDDPTIVECSRSFRTRCRIPVQ